MLRHVRFCIVLLLIVAPAATAEEAELLLRWLDSSGVRLVHLDGVWASPRHGSRGLESALGSNAPFRER